MSNIAYSAVVLDNESRDFLIKRFSGIIPEGWEIIAHHMTINLGELKPDLFSEFNSEKLLGLELELAIKKIGVSDKAIAVEVAGAPTVNKIPHITLAVNRKEGGKPVMSNYITNWSPVNVSERLKGKVEEVPYKR
jgi:hypothetical protein